MALFGILKKKKKEFPEFPKLPTKMPELPKYESPIKEIPEEPEPLRIPIRKPIFAPLPRLPEVREEPREEISTLPPMREAPTEPVYVKLSKYKAAVKLIKEINARLLEAERTLANLTEVKNKESAEIRRWQEELNSIKTKLMEVDKNLFEP